MFEVSDEFIQRFDLKIEIAGHRVPFQAGLHLGSRYVADPERDILFDYLPESLFERVEKKAGERQYRATFIDQ